MKLFQTTQNIMASVGVKKDQDAFDKIKFWMIMISSPLFLTLQIVFVFHEADTPRQYMDSIFMTTTGILVFISTLSIVFRTKKIFDTIADTERLINGSECCLLTYRCKVYTFIRFDSN